MGRKSNRAKGVKNKRGERKQRPSPAAANAPLFDAMRILEEGNTLLGGHNPKKALECKLRRDQLEEAMKTADPEKYDDVIKDKLGEDGLAKIPALSQMLMASMTLAMAKCGVVEDNKHSSISYAEEHADELFEDGEDIVYYDDMIDCINKMNEYSSNEKERNRIAQNGYRKVLDNHTQTQRVDFIIEKFNEWKDSQSA